MPRVRLAARNLLAALGGRRVVAACGAGRGRAMAVFHALMTTGRAPTAGAVRGGFSPLAALGQA